MAHDSKREDAPERHQVKARTAVLRLPESLPRDRVEAGYQAILRLLMPQVREALAQAEPANDAADPEAKAA